MKTVKYALFAFLPSDCEAARQWLTGLYEQGWELSKLSGFLFWPATFVPRTRDGLKYCVDLKVSPHAGDPAFVPDTYQQLVSDSGWELAGICNGMSIYKSRPGMDPAPIYTDPETARRQYWRQAVLPDLLRLLFLLILSVLLAALLRTGFQVLPLLSSGRLLLQGIALALLLLWYLWSPFQALLAWRRYRLRDPDPDVRRARRRGRLAAVAQVLYLYAVLFCSLVQLLLPNGWPLSPAQLSAAPVLQTEDLPGTGPVRSAHRSSSPFLEKLTVEGQVEQTRYDCRFSWVADLAVKETLSSYRYYLDGLAPVDLGFDGSWQAGQVLLLRQGDTVVLLSGEADWTDPALRDMLWERLGLV